MTLLRKTFYFILIGLFLVSFTSNNEPTILKGNLEGFSVKEFYINSYSLGSRDTIPVDATGYFQKELKLETSDFFTLYDKDLDNTFHVYFEPEKKYDLILDSKNQKVIVMGELSNENELYGEIKKRNDSLSHQIDPRKLDETAFMEKMKIFEKSQNELINKFSQNKRLSSDFIRLLKQDVFYTLLNQKQVYRAFHDPSVSLSKYKDYFTKINRNIEEDSTLLKLKSYREVLSFRIWVGYLDRLRKGEWKKHSFEMEFVKGIKTTIKSPTIRKAILFDDLKTGLATSKDPAKMLEIGKSFGIKGKKLQILEKIYADIKKTESGKIAPDFSCDNVDGQAYSLSDFKGKLVYLDFWATWCGSCIAEFPYLKKLKEYFEGKNIEFVSVSLDSDKDIGKWKNFVKQKQLEGIQLHAEGGFNSKIAEEYQIFAIPHFILIGKDGRIISRQINRPSDKNIKQILEKAIEHSNKD